MSRKRVYEIIEKSNGNDKASDIYDSLMLIVIILSLIPLAFKTEGAVLQVLDKGTAVFNNPE